MNSIIIPGMKMPTDCYNCRLTNGLDCYAVADGAEDYVAEHWDNLTKPDWCPLLEVPSADVQFVRRGKWIVLDDRWEFEEVKCSNCGCVEYFNKGWKKFNYCPTCGATMDMGGG